MPKLKICGNHTENDLRVLVEHVDDLDQVGFIFTRKSKRKADPVEIKAWLQAYPELAGKAVAVFLDQAPVEMAEILSYTGISIAQLHGRETLEEIKELRRLSPSAVWKVIPVDAAMCALSMESLQEQIRQKLAHYRPTVDAFLLDTQVKGYSGGTGKTFDWSILPELFAQERSLGTQGKPIWIAGGIGVHNLAELRKLEGLYGVDLASGAETEGQKDRGKLHKLIEGMRS